MLYNVDKGCTMHSKVGDDVIDRSQLLKGTLEGCILKIIGQEETYGYEIVNKLQVYGFLDMKEGTIYPLLVRLEKKGMVRSTYKESPFGPKRKYYTLTPLGSEMLIDFITIWQEISKTVNTIILEV